MVKRLDCFPVHRESSKNETKVVYPIRTTQGRARTGNIYVAALGLEPNNGESTKSTSQNEA
jgi:hypothetical protein